MSNHHVSATELPEGGERFDTSKVSKILLPLMVVGGLGILASLIIFLVPGLKGWRESYSYSWLFAFQVFFSFVLGAFFWVILHNAINAGWGVAIRRIWEHLANMVPVLLVLGLPLVLIPDVRHALWEWQEIHHEAKAEIDAEKGLENVRDVLHSLETKNHDALLDAKYNYLHNGFISPGGVPGWWIRFFLYFGILWGGAHMMRKFSLDQEKDGAFEHTFRARRAACGVLPLFAIAVTFSAIDWVMGLDYTWFSTMWGVYIFAGCAWSSMALTIIIVTWLRGEGYLKKVVTMEHYHLMGKLLFAFTLFWAYIAFSQFFLIWYANITEETRFYLMRNTGGWNYYTMGFLVLGHFAIPFVVLLQVWIKKTPWLISVVCGWIILMHIADVYWLIAPERGPSLTDGKAANISGAFFGDLLAFVTIAATMAFFFLRTLGNYSLYPWRDPRLMESVNVHQ